MLTLRIALRYLVAPKSHNAVNVISLISLGGVAVATAAIVIVLSVFNGFNDLAFSHLSVLDPQLKVKALSGKVFAESDSLCRAIMENVPGAETATPVIEERGLIVSGDAQMPVRFKAVDPASYTSVVDFDKAIIDGVGLDAIEIPAMTMSVGVALETGIRPSPEASAELYVPKRVGKINPVNPSASYLREPLLVGGVFRVEQAEYDTDMIFIPLEVGRNILQYYDSEASAIEISLRAGTSEKEVVKALTAFLGPDFAVETRIQQQATAYRMIAIEKWMTFALLTAILLIAAFNILSTLSLLIIEKRDDVSTLRALGATQPTTRHIFQWEGALITICGGIAGIVLGSILTLCQQHFGWIKLSGDASMLATVSYPVRLAIWPDIAATLACVVALSLLISFATRAFTRHKAN